MIILAEDLAPSETMQFEKDKILAIVTQKGSASSHTAILARVMNIPCIVTADIELDPALSGKPGIVDGFEGKIYIEPDETTSAAMAEKKQKHDETMALLNEMKGLPTVTKIGQKVHLYSNIGGVGDIDAVLRMIHIACKCALEHGAWCGICGELAADMELTDRFLEMGIDELSVSPTYTLKLRKKIRETE